MMSAQGNVLDKLLTISHGAGRVWPDFAFRMTKVSLLGKGLTNLKAL